MDLTMRVSLRFCLLLMFCAMLASALLVWELYGQNAFIRPVSAMSTGRPTQPTTGATYQSGHANWECKKFVFALEGEPPVNSARDLEAFLQTAGQAQLVSSGVPGLGPHVEHYDVIACKKP